MKIFTLVMIFTIAFAAMAFGQDGAGGDPGYINIPVNASLVPGASMSVGQSSITPIFLREFHLKNISLHNTFCNHFKLKSLGCVP